MARKMVESMAAMTAVPMVAWRAGPWVASSAAVRAGLWAASSAGWTGAGMALLMAEMRAV